MYEEFFGLVKRPFPAVAQADDFISLPGIQDCLDSLLQCINRSRGIAVITAGSGMGKSLLCRRLGAQLRSLRTLISISSASFQTRQELLQALLYELNLDYLGLSEQEARLRLLEVARKLAQSGKPLLLILDEAHTLNVRLFDELRSFVDAAPDGVPLMNLVLCGQFELEEKLADPALAAFSQRIGVQVCLPPLSREDSARFITERLLGCGATDIHDVMTPDALAAICRASDGNLRCLSQLADHSLLLAYGVSRKPFDGRLVRDALQDLKELPLHWIDLVELAEEEAAVEAGDLEETLPLAGESTNDEEEAPSDFTLMEDFASNSPSGDTTPNEDEPPMAVLEVGAGLEETGVFDLPDWGEVFAGSTSGADTIPMSESFPETEVAASGDAGWLLPAPAPTEDSLSEVNVVDRYAMLDRVRELPPERQASVDLSALSDSSQVEAGLAHDICADSQRESPSQEAVEAEDVLRTVRQIREEILIAVVETRQVLEERQGGVTVSRVTHCDIVLPPTGANEHTAEEAAGQSPVFPVVDNPQSSVDAPRTRYHDLFTRLSRRRRQCAEQLQRE